MTEFRTLFLPVWIAGTLLLGPAAAAYAQKAPSAGQEDKTATVSDQTAATPDKTAATPAKAAAASDSNAGAKPAAAGKANGKPSANGSTAPEDQPSTQVLSDTLHYDDVKKQSIFTGNVIMTRGLMTMHADHLELHEDAQGGQYGTATANPGKMVNIRQERPDTFELIDGTGLRAEYDGPKDQFDLIGQAVVIRYVCGKQFDTIRGERVRYNEKAGTYEAMGGPGSSAPGGRVRSVVEPRAKTDAAIEECRKEQAAKGVTPAAAPAKTTAPAKPATPAAPRKTR